MNDCEKKDREQIPERKRKTSPKQVVAMAGVILLALLYLIALAAAFLDRSQSGRWFMGCALATVAVPLLVWIYAWLYGKITGRHSISDPIQEPENASDREEDSSDAPKDR